jgi:predicted DNA-binding transcriptional regulator AlpA
MDQLLKVKDILPRLKMSKPAFYRCPDLMKIRIKIGRSSFWSEQAIEEWITAQRKLAVQDHAQVTTQ